MQPRLLLACLALLSIGLWLWSRGAEPTTPVDAGEKPPAPERHVVQSAGQTTGTPDAARRTLPGAGTADAPRLGDLRVAVRWADDSPAPGISLVLRYTSPGSMPFAIDELRSDAAGMATFRGLRPGEVSLRSDRTKGWQSTEAEIVAGRTTELVLKLEEGFDVEGRVVDERGAGVAGADIWMSRRRRDWLGGLVVGRSGDDGAFSLRAVPMGNSLGALYPDRSPSALFDLDDADLAERPLHVTLRLGPPGGSLRGRVLDPAGSPVADAVVCLGAMPERFMQRPKGNSYTETWTPLTTRSAEDGSYSFPGVAPGTQPLAARKPGFAIHRAEVELGAGQQAVRDLTLTLGFAVTGTVSDADGSPMAAARVRVFERAFAETYIQSGQYDYEDVFPYLYADTDAEGRYRIEHVPAGERLLYAGSTGRPGIGGIVPYAKTTLTGAEGEALRWDPRVSGGLQIQGRALFRDGQPMNSHFVIATRSGTGAQHVGHTDKEGRFRFIHLDPVGYTVRVQMWDPPKDTAPLQQHNVTPGPGELRLVATYDGPKKEVPGSVKGRIEDAAGVVPRPETLEVVLQTARGWRPDPSLEDGAFRFEDVQPGRYKVVARAGGRIVVVGPFFDLAAGQDLDVGTLRTVPGGSLKLTLIAPDGAPAPSIRGVWLRAPDSTQSQVVAIRPGQTVRLDGLLPGEHHLSLAGSNVMSETAAVEVVAGGVTEHAVTLRPAVLVLFHFHFASDPSIGHLAYALRDTAGKVVREGTLTHGSFLTSPSKLSMLVERGSYELEVTTKNGLRGKARVEVSDYAPAKREVVVRLE